MSATKTKQTEQYQYIVHWPFDDYGVGDEFIPEGHRNDSVIIEHFCIKQKIVYNENEPVEKEPAKSKSGRKK